MICALSLWSAVFALPNFANAVREIDYEWA
jgi:hypothetical protein